MSGTTTLSSMATFSNTSRAAICAFSTPFRRHYLCQGRQHRTTSHPWQLPSRRLHLARALSPRPETHPSPTPLLRSSDTQFPQCRLAIRMVITTRWYRASRRSSMRPGVKVLAPTSSAPRTLTTTLPLTVTAVSAGTRTSSPACVLESFAIHIASEQAKRAAELLVAEKSSWTGNSIAGLFRSRALGEPRARPRRRRRTTTTTADLDALPLWPCAGQVRSAAITPLALACTRLESYAHRRTCRRGTVLLDLSFRPRSRRPQAALA